MRRIGVVLAVVLAALAATAGSPAYAGCAPGPDLHFRAADGTKLVGHRFGAGKTFVVLAHQYGGDLCQWVPYAKRLTSLGYTALAFDLRGFGLSQKRYGDALIRYDRDAVAAAKLAHRLGARKVFLVGASLGANAVLVAATETLIDGVVSLSAPATFRLDAVASAKKLTVPVLYLAGTFDGTYRAEAMQMYKATASANKSIAFAPTAEHGVALVSHKGKLRDLVERFLASGRAG